MDLREITGRFPGVSCAWVDAVGTVRTACYGVADRERNVPVEAGTVFPACSISKFVTALCVLKLQEQHKLDIDAPVNDYLRTWKLRTPEGNESHATIRQLLSHTAGVADGDDAFYGHRRNDPPISLMDVLTGATAYNNRPACAENEPGAAFEYSDAGYCVLQLLAEEVAHKPFDAVARELVFAPLGLKNTFFMTRANMDIMEACHSVATGYDGEALPIPGRFPISPDTAASALWSTPTELLTIGRAFIAAYQGDSDFLQAASAKEIAAPVVKFPWTCLGLFIAGEDAVMSQGWGENGQCMLNMHLCTGRIAVVMTNRNPEVDQTESGVEWMVDTLLQR